METIRQIKRIGQDQKEFSDFPVRFEKAQGSLKFTFNRGLKSFQFLAGFRMDTNYIPWGKSSKDSPSLQP